MQDITAQNSMHRDIYASVQAGELLESGYYGETVEILGCYIWLHDTIFPIIMEDELTLYQKILQVQRQGGVASPVVMKTWHIYDQSFSKAEMEYAMLEKLSEIYPIELQKFVQEMLLHVGEKEHIFLQRQKNYLDSLSNEALDQKADILRDFFIESCIMKKINKKEMEQIYHEYPALQKNAVTGMGSSCFSGFAWLDTNNNWKYFVDAYLPNVIRKRTTLQAEGRLVAPIYQKALSAEKNKPPYLLREEFLTQLRFVQDERFLYFLQEQNDFNMEYLNEKQKAYLQKALLTDIKERELLLRICLYYWNRVCNNV